MEENVESILWQCDKFGKRETKEFFSCRRCRNRTKRKQMENSDLPLGMAHWHFDDADADVFKTVLLSSRHKALDIYAVSEHKTKDCVCAGAFIGSLVTCYAKPSLLFSFPISSRTVEFVKRLVRLTSESATQHIGLSSSRDWQIMATLGIGVKSRWKSIIARTRSFIEILIIIALCR